MTARRHRIAALALAVVLTSGVAACGEDDGAGEPTPPEDLPSTIDTEALPPPTALELEPLYGDALAAVGMRLTDRGGLIDRSGGGYVASASGQHLALYVEPIDADRTMQEYFDGILDVALVFSDIYDRWPELQTYDVCQEPPDPDGNQGEEPLPVTQIELTRAQSDAIDWDSVTVEDLVRGAQEDPPALALRVSSDMAAFPAYGAIAGSGNDDNNNPYS